MPSDQITVTDNAQRLLTEYFDLASVLQAWRSGQAYPFNQLIRLLALDRDVEALILQINLTSAQRSRFWSQLGLIRTSLQKFGGTRLASYIRERLGEIWSEGEKATSIPAGTWESRMTETFQVQELINSSMLVVSADERDELLTLWVDGASRIDEIWRTKIA